MNRSVIGNDTVIVAALENGNDTVKVIDAVDAFLRPDPESSTVSIRTTVSFPFPSAIAITAVDHVDVHDHVYGNDRNDSYGATAIQSRFR